MIQDYKLANLEQRALKLKAQRQEILTSQSEKALDLIFEAPSPATLVQSFPDQDLYFLMHKIGGQDFLPVLAMATSAQWEYILDVEVWNDDRLDIRTMTQAFDLLFQADPKRLLRWIIKEKPDYFEFYLFENMTVFIREHDEWIPEDFDDYITLDDKFYFRFPHKIDPDDPDAPNETADPTDPGEDLGKTLTQDAPELIERMLRTLAEMDLSVYHGLLLETCAVQGAETEEEQFRLRNVRLAEKGFLPAHEAIGIYQPTDVASLRKRPASARSPEAFDPDMPLPPQLFTQFIEGDTLFIRALDLLDPDFILLLQSELAALSNKIISADRVKIRNPESIQKIIQKATAYLSLGLEVMIRKEPTIEAARDIIEHYFLEDIFRTGSRAGIQLKTKAKTWYKTSFMKEKNLPLGFMTEDYLGVMGGLFLERPMYFDNYREGQLYRHFTSLADIKITDTLLTRIIHIDQMLAKLPLDVRSFTHGVLTYKSLILTLWARNRLGLDKGGQCSLNPIEPSVFKPFFAALFSSDIPGKIDDLKGHDLSLFMAELLDCHEDDLTDAFLEVLSGLIREIGEEYGSVAPGDMDPRFILHFLLAPEPRKNKKPTSKKS
ncbi:MAG: hypothetical protein KKC20_11915 [Proteobacteria bacterium]|nr:hypothetical protein [Pseudomonadota bacterium]